MNFIYYLKTKKKILIFWTVFNLLALYAWHFEMQGKVLKTFGLENKELTYSNTDNHSSTELEIYFFRRFNQSYEECIGSFYPFVKFFEHHDWYHSVRGQYGNVFGRNVSNYTFNGIFYNYDESEFIAYTILIFIFLYYRYNKLKNKQLKTMTKQKVFEKIDTFQNKFFSSKDVKEFRETHKEIMEFIKSYDFSKVLNSELQIKNISTTLNNYIYEFELNDINHNSDKEARFYFQVIRHIFSALYEKN